MTKSMSKERKRSSGGTEGLTVRFTSAGRKLSQAQRQRVEQRLKEDVRYVHHPSFGRLAGQGAYTLGEDCVATGPDEQTSVSSALAGQMAPFSHLLSKEEERDLFLRMNYARFRLCSEADEARKKPVPIGKAREILDWDRMASNARKQLVQSNMPLVLSMAKKMRIQGVDFCDVVCEGNMALLRAVDGFDCSRGFKFSTYACRAILKSFA